MLDTPGSQSVAAVETYLQLECANGHPLLQVMTDSNANLTMPSSSTSCDEIWRKTKDEARAGRSVGVLASRAGLPPCLGGSHAKLIGG